ncbi:MAG: nucleoside deaminase [Planctomycetes bacterium]|nr:nucleoside deaminase [Planctomycetota bacterium]
MVAESFEIRLPPWLSARLVAPLQATSASERARFAIDLAARNIEHGTGGPFGAAVFQRASGKLVAVGVNLVLSTGLSCAHAEVVALSLAQRALGTPDLAPFDLELATSAEPCWMCLGAIHWSGVRSVIASARDEDVRAIGFDEGAKPADWTATLRERGTAVAIDVERDAAIAVLRRYAASGGEIYNAGE